MAQALRTTAKRTEDVAAGFTVFRKPLPGHAAEITAVVADLFAISACLIVLEGLTRRELTLIEPDLNLVQASLKYTLEDIVDYFQDIDPDDATPEDYMHTWMGVNKFFWDESRYSLATRLAKYNAMLRELRNLSTNNYHEPRLFATLQHEIKVLLSIQDNRLASRLGRMNLGRTPSNSSSSAGPSSPVSDRRPGRRRSYERTRPGRRPSTMPPSSSPTASSDRPPSVPEAPSSRRTSATTESAHSGVSDFIRDHWCKEVFRSTQTSTPLASTEEGSRCCGDPQPDAKHEIRRQGYEEVLKIAMNDVTEVTVSFWLKPTTRRARILLKVPDRRRSVRIEDPSRRRYYHDYYCLPLEMLELMRDDNKGTCLRLCRRRKKGTELVLWALLRFSTLEDLVFFHGTFLALRSQDEEAQITRILDHDIKHEDLLFSGPIKEDGYTHGLRVYEDLTTNAFRLQSSVLYDDKRHTPVWTAFITHNLRKPNWFERADDRTIILRDIWPVVFMSADDFIFPQTRDGDHVLRFELTGDAHGFMKLLKRLSKSRH
ncbi:hypothetical protein N7535_003776 [Penicillium sp. DV-2018c]|nr:hypothetical protein N7461_000524 [Penicillium sp. DV-2018c]KAJ5576850.1 hypothetical protein N7535_003776 [Penicillium sp. DV-2018c]